MSTVPIPDSFFIHLAGTITYVDQNFRALVGAEGNDQLIGTTVADIVAPEFESVLREHIEQIQNGDESVLALTVELDTIDTQPQRVILVSSLVMWEGTRQVQTTVLPSDSGSTAALNPFQEAMDEAPIGITISDPSQPDNPLIYVNDEFCDLTGYQQDEVLGKNCRFLQGEATREEPVRKMREAIDAEESVTVDIRNYHKGGSMFWNRVTIIPLRFDSDTVTHYLGYQQDISAEKRYEQDLTLFKEHAQESQKSIKITGPDGTILYVNPAFEELSGFTAAEAIGHTPRLTAGTDDDAVYEELWDHITTGEIWEGTSTAKTKYGERYEVDQRVIPVTDEDNEITHFVWIQQDITETVLTTQAMSVLNRVLRHNLRNALTVIDGNAELIRSDQVDSEQRDTLLAAIREEANSMKQVAEKIAALRDVWDHTRSHHTWEHVDIEGLGQRYRNQYPDATITVTIQRDRPIQVRNAAAFGFALNEAVENAIKHTEASPPVVEIMVGNSTDDDRLQISIADTGPGIPKIDRQPIETGEETQLAHSLGVGLWAMDWIARALGGDLEIQENEPQGSVVTFLLPDPSNQEGIGHA